MSALMGCEQRRKGEGDLRPFGILFVPAIVVSQHRMNLGITFAAEMKAAMARCRMAENAVSIVVTLLRGSPGCRYPHPCFGTGKRQKLALVLGDFFNMSAKGRFVLSEAVGTGEV